MADTSMAETTARIRALLPRGTALPERTFWARHRAIVGVIALHLPVLLALGFAEGAPPVGLLAGLVPLAAITALAIAPIGRIGRMLAATVGLSLCSALLILLTGGLVEAHFHVFFALALIALYQDWRPYLAALGGVIAHHTALGLLSASIYSYDAVAGSPLRAALVHGGFVVAVGITHLVFWKVTEDQAETSRELWRQLYEGERALVERLRAAESVKSELLSVVSHEFRTPLTAIIGFSHTLMARADQLDPATIRLCVRNIDQQSRRLARLVHNVLAASGDVATDPTAVTDLSTTACAVSREIHDAYDADAPAIAVDSPPVLRATIDGDAAHRVLLNLLDNAVKFGAHGTEVELRLRAEGSRAVIEVANVASPIAVAQLDRIFQPFVQEDSSDNRAVDGIGLGLHVVRRLLHAYDGSIAVEHRGGRVVFVAALPLAARGSTAIDLADALPGRVGDLRVEGLTAPLRP